MNPRQVPHQPAPELGRRFGAFHMSVGSSPSIRLMPWHSGSGTSAASETAVDECSIRVSRQPIAEPMPVLRKRPTDSPSCAGRRQFSAAVFDVFRATGGLISADMMVARLRTRVDQPLSRVARWIVRREVLSLQSCGRHCMPLFQFDPESLSIRQSVSNAIGELKDVFDPGELLVWFATPHGWLVGRCPAACVQNEVSALIHAARADRFVATGD